MSFGTCGLAFLVGAGATIFLSRHVERAPGADETAAAKEVREHGTFGYIDTSLATPDMNAFLRG